MAELPAESPPNLLQCRRRALAQHGHSPTDYALNHLVHRDCCAGPICGVRTGFAIEDHDALAATPGPEHLARRTNTAVNVLPNISSRGRR
jgi:hypothetical protein